jgi:hypothetical protein
MRNFVIILPSFLRVCVCVCVGNRICRLDVILSNMVKGNIITLTNEIVDPIDEIMFHVI